MLSYNYKVLSVIEQYRNNRKNPIMLYSPSFIKFINQQVRKTDNASI